MRRGTCTSPPAPLPGPTGRYFSTSRDDWIEPRKRNLVVREESTVRVSERRRDGAEVAVAHRGRRHRVVQGAADVLNRRALPAGEEEQLVAHDRAARIAAELFALQEVPLGQEEVFRVERAVARVAERAAVEVVGARAGDGVDDRAGARTLRGAVVAGLNRELLQRVRERERLVLLEVRVGVVRAVETERRLPRLGAVGREAQRAGNRLARFLVDFRHDHARDEHAEPRGVAAVQRQLDDPLRVDDFGDRRRGDVDRGGLARDRDGLGQIAKLERDVEREVLVGRQDDVRLTDRPEARELGSNLVRRRPQRHERISSVRTGHRLARHAGAGFDSRDRHAWHNAAAVVGDDAVDLSCRLRKRAADRQTQN